MNHIRHRLPATTHEYVHLFLYAPRHKSPTFRECAVLPDISAFKSLLHQTMQTLFGHVYAALSIDILHFERLGNTKIEVVMRILSSDRDMVLQTLPCMCAYQGQRTTVLLQATTPHLFLITKKQPA